MNPANPEAETILSSPAVGELEAEAATIMRETDETLLEQGRERTPKKEVVLPRGGTLGRYVILDRLGSGGMGVVYAAYDPELDRRVAIKLLRTEEDARDDDATAGRARLLREAQAMARLTHPSVIAVYDVGTYEGSVFFAMEFVAGRTIREHFKEAWAKGEPDWRETVRLFVAAGKGLAAAHRVGVVHRDFKPDNVMLGEDGRVLVLDFGLARPTGDASPLSSDSIEVAESSPALATSGISSAMSAQLTKTGTVMGTPAYMSPEQMTGRPTDAPTDQFSFCVALYQALYNERPFQGDSFADLSHNVLRTNVRPPPKGSHVPQWLRKAIIVGLQRKPDLRYPSMDALLLAIQRDPRRRWRMLGLAGLGVALLSTAAVVGARVGRSKPCRDAAAGIDEVWNETRSANVGKAFGDVGKAYADDAYAKVVPILDRYADEWRTQREDACQATRVRGEQSDEVMGLRMACLDNRLHRMNVFVNVLEDGGPAAAGQAIVGAMQLPSLDTCADLEALRSDVPPPDDPETRAEVDAIRLEISEMVARTDHSKVSEARPVMDALVERAEALDYPPILAEALANKAELEQNLGNFEEAADAAWRALLLAESSGHDRMIVSLGLLLARTEGAAQKDIPAARRHLERAQAVLQRLPKRSELQRQLFAQRGDIERFADEWETALTYYERAREILIETGKDREPPALNLLNALAPVYLELDRVEDAKRVSEEAVELGRELFGPMHPNIGVTLSVLGRLATTQGDPEGAIEYLTKAREVFVSSLGAQHANVGAIDNALGLSYHHLGKLEEALASYESSRTTMTRIYGDDHLDVAAVHTNLGNIYRDKKDYDEAIEHHRKSLEIKSRKLAKDHKELGFSTDNLAEDYRRAGKHEDALEMFGRTLALIERTDGTDSPRMSFALAGIGMIELERGNVAAARASLDRAVVLNEKDDADDESAARARFGLAQVLWAQGEHERAVQLARDAERGLAEDESYYLGRLSEIRAWIADRE